MNEEKEFSKTIGEMGVEEFFATMVHVLNQRKTQGDPKLMEMSVKEFTDLMLERMKTRAYGTAQAEADVASRVLTDWQGLMAVDAVTQPFRVTNAKEAYDAAEGLADFFKKGGKGAFVVAVAVATSEGGYQRYNK